MLALHAFFPFLDPFAFFPILNSETQWLHFTSSFAGEFQRPGFSEKNQEFTILPVAAEHNEVYVVNLVCKG